MRKKLPALALACFLVFVAPLTASAHPGRTDSSGGHRDSSTGEYHYHHGYEAHQHYDMDGDGDIDCPYNFNDQTTHSPGSSSSSSNSNKKPAKSESKSVSAQLTSASVSTSDTKGDSASMIGWIISFALGIALIASLSHNDTESRRANDIMRGKDIAAKLQKDEYEAKISKLSNSASYWEKKSSELQEMVSSLQPELEATQAQLRCIEAYPSKVSDSSDPTLQLSALSSRLLAQEQKITELNEVIFIYEVLSRIPRNVTFHYKDGLPVYGEPTPASPYGKWTVWLNRKSGIYHADHACSSYSGEAVHISVAAAEARPCKRCADESYVFTKHPQWYTDYLLVRDRAYKLGLEGLDNLETRKPTPADLNLYRHLM